MEIIIMNNFKELKKLPLNYGVYKFLVRYTGYRKQHRFVLEAVDFLKRKRLPDLRKLVSLGSVCM